WPQTSRRAKNSPPILASTMRSRSTATNFISPGARSPTAATAVKPSSMRDPITGASRRRSGLRPETASLGRFGLERSVRLETEHSGGILRGDLFQILLGHAVEHAVEELLRARERRLGMRIIAAPQHVLDADIVAQLDADIVFHELDKHVALPVVARHQPFSRAPALGEHRALDID